ncbi:MAG: Bacterial luciferase-like monooxygenase [Candidatus Angelobacter sp.]|nr:Bacterial luciferase-like monooxygenase [Candidatus Angelobacter sp.]
MHKSSCGDGSNGSSHIAGRLTLSVLDQSPISEGYTPADALQQSISLASLADRLGYDRYWIAEHHASQSFASPAPEILITKIAAETATIRVGSGGVLLPHYSPFKVAETFRTLHALYPGRVDLGIGRAPGGNPLEAYALRRDRTEHPRTDDFSDQIRELLNLLHGTFPTQDPLAGLKVTPEMPGSPDVWLLGSSTSSASKAAEMGLPYAFAHFIDPSPTRKAIEEYHTRVSASTPLRKPRTIVALAVLCADTEEEARREVSSAWLFKRRVRQGIIRPIPTVKEALAELGACPVPREEATEWPSYIVGAPEQVRDQLHGIAHALHLDELMVVTIVHDPWVRKHSYELLAEVFELPARVRKVRDAAMAVSL